MRKLNQLLKKVEMFEKLAVYGDRKTFLQSLAQGYSQAPFQGNVLVGDSFPPPAPTPTKPPTSNYAPFDKKVQNMLNELLVPSGTIFPIDLDGKLGDKTKNALEKFKVKYNKPASIANITEEFNKYKKISNQPTNQSTNVLTPSDAPLPFNKPNLPGNDKPTASQSAGEVRSLEVGPKP